MWRLCGLVNLTWSKWEGGRGREGGREREREGGREGEREERKRGREGERPWPFLSIDVRLTVTALLDIFSACLAPSQSSCLPCQSFTAPHYKKVGQLCQQAHLILCI